MAPPKIEPKERRRRAIPRRVTSIPVGARTEREQRAIRAEMRRVGRLLSNTQRAAVSRVLRPLQDNVDALLRQREQQGMVAFARSGGAQRLERAQHQLEQERQRVIHEYLRPIRNYSYFWEGQYHGNLPPGPPPPPPPGGGYLNITHRALS